jgi:hypothetical protein
MSWIRLLVAIVALGGLGRSAFAARMALDPLTRVHTGLSLASPTSMGLMLGMDSRLTQLIYVDVTGFMSVSDPVAKTMEPDADGANTWMLRHGLYCTPGLRIPHKQPETWSWDILTRAGFGAVWLADAASNFDLESNPALVGGGELVVRKSQAGLRLSAKALYVRPYSKYRLVESSIVRAQYGTEMFYQF